MSVKPGNKTSFWIKLRRFAYLFFLVPIAFLTLYIAATSIKYDLTAKANPSGYCTADATGNINGYVPEYHHHHINDVVYVVLCVSLVVAIVGLKKFHGYAYKTFVLLFTIAAGVGILVSTLSDIDFLGSIGCLPF